jgi:hypothetical protein
MQPIIRRRKGGREEGREGGRFKFFEPSVSLMLVCLFTRTMIVVKNAMTKSVQLGP